MKQINETFEDREHKEFTIEKEKLNMNWHDFLLFILRKYKDNQK